MGYFLLLPLSSHTMSFLHNSTTIQPFIAVTEVDTLIYRKKTKHGAAEMIRSMSDSSVHCNVAHNNKSMTPKLHEPQSLE
jgi:hypothetical protein